MVQRKVVNKLDVQSQSQSDNRFANLRPCSLQSHDAMKSRKVDKKKMMKRSGALKRLEFDALGPHDLSPQTPNYMKSTSSSSAKKEQPQSQVGWKSSSSSSLHHEKYSVVSGNKEAKTLARPSGLKMVRSLMKNSSFKSGKSPLMRKCNKVVLCENLDVYRATCSSTLKDCKLPDSLMLHPGGTELEGTSVFKVCPYSYCSLNGHLHANLPPLKSFLSWRRRMLKMQRNLKPGCLPLRQEGPAVEVNFDEKHQTKGELDVSNVCPLAEKDQIDFFIGIHGQGEENDWSAGGSGMAELVLKIGGTDETEEQDYERVLETEDINFNDNLDIDSLHTDVDAYPGDKEAQGILVIWNEYLAEIKPNDHHLLNEVDSEASDMECDSAQYQDVDYDYFSNEDEINPGISKATFIQESLRSHTFSSRGDSESVVSLEYLEGLNDTNTNSTPVEVPKEELEATCDDFVFENSHTRGRGTAAQTSDKVTCMPCNLMVDSITILDVSDHTYTDKGLWFPAEERLKSPSPIDFATESSRVFIDTDEVKTENAFDATKSETNYCSIALSTTRNSGNSQFLGGNLNQDLLINDGFTKETANFKKSSQESEEAAGHEFNPRAPNFLPPEPAPDVEKVDLRHQELDEKKNAEEWMVDYTLRQTVTRLGQARNKKVALLVEAFEKVMPVTKCEVNLRHSSAFDHARPIQACN